MHDRINLPVYSEIPVISKFSMRSFNEGGPIETSHGELGNFFGLQILSFQFTPGGGGRGIELLKSLVKLNLKPPHHHQ